MLRLDWNIVFTIINILVLYVILKKFLFRPVMGIIDKRQGLIDSQLADAKDKQDKATDMQKQYEQILDGAAKESADLVVQAKDRAGKEYDKKVKEADAQAALRVKQAEETIEIERRKVMDNLKVEISQLALLTAERILREENTPDLNRGIYKQFLVKAGEVDDTDRS